MDSVKGSAFEELITGDPEGEAIFQGAIEANATDLTIILTSSKKWHWVAVF